MTEPRIVLAGMGMKLSGLTWESDRALRIGRQCNLDVVLRDHSVDRVHAEVRYQGRRWVLRDLAQNPLYPIFVNDAPMAGRDREIRADDVIRVGKLQLRVMSLVVPEEQIHPNSQKTPTIGMLARGEQKIATSGAHMLVKAKTQQTWDTALEGVTGNAAERQQQEPAMLALIRANRNLAHVSHLDELLHSILMDAMGALNAQRGSILLTEPETNELTLRATAAPNLSTGSPARRFSKTLVRRCFEQGESILCDDVNADESLVLARSIRHGAMASVICVLLRTPSKKLGVMHLDRGFLDDPFNQNDLYCADTIAASVAVGIETAQIVETQRNQMIETVTALASTVELRDQYNGGHTRRVTDFALLLADELKLSAGEKYQIQIGTPLHDIGKLSIDDAILRKPGKLTAGEFESMKSHTTKGAVMLDNMKHLGPMIPIVRHHHERWDGSGYPDGLSEDQIPLIARIVSIADAFDAMISDRPYRPAMSMDRAFLELIGKAGSSFDPKCIYSFVRLRPKIEERMQGDLAEK